MQRLIVLPALLTLVGCIGPSQRLVDSATLAVPADGAEIVRLVQGIGDATVVGDPSLSEVVLVAELFGPELDESADDAALDDLIVELDRCGERICAATDLRDPHLRYRLDTELRVPAELAVAIRDDLGDLQVRDVAALDVRDGSGDLDIERVRGALLVDDDLGDTWIRDVAGPVDVIDGSGDLRIDEVRGDVVVDDDLGDLDVLNVDGDVEIEDGSGDIRVVDVTGDVSIADDLGDIVVRRIGGTLTILADTTGDVTTHDVQNGVVHGD